MNGKRLLAKKMAAVAALGVCVLTPSALAGGAEFGLNIDVQAFSIFPNRPASTYGAASGQDGFWNIVYPTGGSISLANLDGVPSGVTATQTEGNTNTRTQCVGGFVNVNWAALMCDHHWDAAGVVNFIEYEFSGIPAGVYDLYTYACGPGESFQPGFAVGVWVDDDYTGTAFISGAVLSQAFEVGRTHDLRQITIQPGDNVRVRVFDTSGEFGDPVYLNGLQFVKQDDLSATIAAPGPLACVCDPVQITGTAAGAGFSSYKLEYSMSGNDPWTEITTSTTAVNNGVLASWNAAGLAEGYYTLRLTVQNADGQSSTSVRTVYLNQAFDPIDLRSPDPGLIYGGDICLDGTVWDQCFTRYQSQVQTPGGTVDTQPGTPFYFSPVINDPISFWDSTGFPDGPYQIDVTGFNSCGDTDTASVDIIVDNTLPTVEITTPDGCDSFCDSIAIIGTAFDENMESWVLQYSGGNNPNWTTIASGTNNVINDVLAVWDASNLPDCCYAIRLIAVDKAIVNCGSSRNRTEYVTSVRLGNPLDVDGDGNIGSVDLAALLGSWGAACP